MWPCITKQVTHLVNSLIDKGRTLNGATSTAETIESLKFQFWFYKGITSQFMEPVCWAIYKGLTQEYKKNGKT